MTDVFLAFLGLGLSSFGGPVAHLGYFREAFVVRRRWLTDGEYADLVALCQFLPGPASSQVGIGIGLARAGLPGALAAWLGFTLPSAVAMTLLGVGALALGGGPGRELVHGLEVAVVAVVALATWDLGHALCTDTPRRLLALSAAAGLVLMPSASGQILVLVAGALLGLTLPAETPPLLNGLARMPVSRTTATSALMGLLLVLVLLPIATSVTGSASLALVEVFVQTGSLVFGGGHVVLPLLESRLVASGMIGTDLFMAGYGVAQALPGPLFTFAAYLGAVASTGPGGVAGSALCLCAIFLPAFLLVIGALPFWAGLRRTTVLRQMLAGVNAAVVGLLLAALIDPVCTSGLQSPGDLALALAALLALACRRAPQWAVVGVTVALSFGAGA